MGFKDIDPISIMTTTLSLKKHIIGDKKSKDPDKKDYYNVYVYQILPYPPQTKNPHTYPKTSNLQDSV
jgi:hypothetical protein